MIAKFIPFLLPNIASTIKIGNMVSINRGTLIINDVDVTTNHVANA
jgi:hypothetical protein